jgi:hypothetical protein
VARERPSTYLHTNTNTQPRGFGWRVHCGVEVTVLSTNKQHTLSESVKAVAYHKAQHALAISLKLAHVQSHALNMVSP